jgi:DNA-binding NarL/FixJ family response regulator
MTTKVLLISSDAYAARRLTAASASSATYQLLVAGTRAEAMFHLRTDQIGVLATDEDTADGDPIALLEQAAREHPTIARLYMASQVDLPMAMRLINRAGVFRLLPKPTHVDEFAFAIDAAINAQTARNIDHQLRTRDTASGGSFVIPTASFDCDEALAVEGQPLSRREREILMAVVEGKKPAEIARLFFISVHTARNHIKALYRKLKVHSQVELIAKVLKTNVPARPRQVG